MITRIDEYIVHVPNLQPLTPSWYILSDAEHAEPAKCGEVGRSSMKVFLNKNHGILIIIIVKVGFVYCVY